MGKKKVLKTWGKRCMRKGVVGEKGLVRQFPAIFSFIFYPLCAKHQILLTFNVFSIFLIIYIDLCTTYTFSWAEYGEKNIFAVLAS
jgi:hypothetical protein